MGYLKQSQIGNFDIKRWTIIFIVLTFVIFNKSVISDEINTFCEPFYNFLEGYSTSLVMLLRYCSTEIMLLPFILFIPKINDRSLLSFITPRNKFDEVKLLSIIAIYSVVVLLSLCIELYTGLEFYKFQFDLFGFIGLFIVSCLFIAIKTFVTEFIFCGYFTQFFSYFTSNRLKMIIFLMVYYYLSKIYTIPLGDFTIHNIIFFLFIGCFYGVIVLLCDGLEMTLGMSFINYLLPILFVSDGSVPSIFSESEGFGLDIFYYISIFVNVCYVIFVINAFGIKDWKQRLGIDRCFKR